MFANLGHKNRRKFMKKYNKNLIKITLCLHIQVIKIDENSWKNKIKILNHQ